MALDVRTNTNIVRDVRWRLAALAAALLAVLGSSADASADLNLPYMGPSSGWFLPVGADLGVAILPNSSPGALLGGEASLVYFDTQGPSWFGAFASAAFITNANQGRFSIGPEAGFAIFGIDGGLLDVVASGQDFAGVTVRPMLTVGFATLYARWDHTFSHGGADAGQIGALIKFPVPVTGEL
jgi:hypothetical protein